MSPVPSPESRVLIVVEPDRSEVQTVEYGVREARDSAAELGMPIDVDVWVIDSGDDSAATRRTRTRIEAVLRSFDPDDQLRASVDVHPLDVQGMSDRTDALLESADIGGFSRLILAADSEFSIQRLREVLGVTTVELAPTAVAHEQRRLLHPGGLRRVGAVFGVTYLFYLAVGGFAGGLDLLTGAISAGVVALALSHVALQKEPTLPRTGRRLVRMAVFLPILLWEIVKANFVIAYLILHPQLPIDPAFDIHETNTRSGLERMVLANSITLTPGTLTIDVHEEMFTIHSLTASARDEIEGGQLERLVGWVFHGRTEPLQGEEEGGDG